MHVETSITMDAHGPSYAPGHYEHIDVGGHEEESVGEREHDGDSQNGGKPARVETSILGKWCLFVPCYVLTVQK